ncbi:MAG: hypothetical protein GF331_09725 [Chitinivibrionales bacterium]|nr:hypothetical protein [Chitinivibrionales bacterium]
MNRWRAWPEAVIIGTLILLSGCDEKSVTVELEPEQVVYVAVYAYDRWDILSGERPPGSDLRVCARGEGDPVPEVTGITVDGKEPDTTETSDDWLVAMATSPDSLPVPVTITVSTTQGSCSGAVTVPVLPSLISHSERDTVRRDEPLTVVWQDNAEYYSLRVFVTDTTDSTEFFDTTLTDTSLTFGVNDVRSCAKVRMEMYSSNGARQGWGSLPNMSGDITGYAMGYNRTYSMFKNDVNIYFGGD